MASHQPAAQFVEAVDADRIFEADALREGYNRLLALFYSEPVDPNSIPLTEVEEEHLAAMTDEDRKLRMELLVGVGSERNLQRDLQLAIDQIVKLLQDAKKKRVGKAGFRPRSSKDESNLSARDALKGQPPEKKKRWTQRDLAKVIGCAYGQVGKLPAWQAYYQEMVRGKKSTAPKAVRLTSAVQAVKGQDDAELERLIAEHTADFEESPLVSHARKPRRRTRL
jgi:transcriptional regulator with XRE-family HTH domain